MRRRLKTATVSEEALLAKLHAWLAVHPQLTTLAIYSALPGEVPLTQMVLDHPERRWGFPRVNGDALAFHEVRDPDTDLSTGNFGIREPRADLQEIRVEEIDVFFCPGLAFDQSGGRLGRGKGFYDRILAQAREDALKIGICHPFQLVEKLDSEPHDIGMDEVIFC